jgi:hypothetical protein
MATMEQALHLVGLLEQELMRRRPDIARFDRYYRGEHPLVYASDAFRQYHAQRYAGMSDNWTSIVADAPVERLTVNGVLPAGDTRADVESWRVWNENALDVDSQLAFLGAGNSGRSFVLVWGDPADADTPIVTFEDASQCVVLYEPGSRRRRRAGLKRWTDGGREYATLYLPDEVWKFTRSALGTPDKSQQVRNADAEINEWAPRTVGNEPNPQPNPMGVVPLVELQNKPTLTGEPISDIAGVIAMQDAVNLMWAQMFTAADYAATPQRIVLGAERPMIPILGADGEVVGERPVDLERFAVDRVLFVTGEDAKVDSWQAANLNAFTDVIEVAVGHIAAQTRTPAHYLVGRIVNVSGDALLAAETGLVQKTEQKSLWYGHALREVFSLIALAQGDATKAKALSAGKVIWSDIESRSQAQTADAILKLRQVGFPFEFLAGRYGLSPQEVADVMAMKEAEAALDPMGQMFAHDPDRSVDADGGSDSAPAIA